MMISKELLENAKDLKILFVEDHSELRDALTDILDTFFEKVDSAKNGEEALEMYAKNGYNYYDIILTDIKMPKLNGVLLIESIYNMNPHQQIVVLSAHDETEYLLPLINLGIARFIKKPLDYQELMTVLIDIAKKLHQEEITNSNNTNGIIHLNHACTFDTSKKLFYENGQNIYFTKFEIIFFTLLTKDVGKIYQNEDIVEYFRTVHEEVDPQNIRKLVSKLRKKIPADLIESIYGVGYRLVPLTLNL